jgi:hypothetical protein
MTRVVSANKILTFDEAGISVTGEKSKTESIPYDSIFFVKWNSTGEITMCYGENHFSVFTDSSVFDRVKLPAYMIYLARPTSTMFFNQHHISGLSITDLTVTINFSKPDSRYSAFNSTENLVGLCETDKEVMELVALVRMRRAGPAREFMVDVPTVNETLASSNYADGLKVMADHLSVELSEVKALQEGVARLRANILDDSLFDYLRNAWRLGSNFNKSLMELVDTLLNECSVDNVNGEHRWMGSTLRDALNRFKLLPAIKLAKTSALPPVIARLDLRNLMVLMLRTCRRDVVCVDGYEREGRPTTVRILYAVQNQLNKILDKEEALLEAAQKEVRQTPAVTGPRVIPGAPAVSRKRPAVMVDVNVGDEDDGWLGEGGIAQVKRVLDLQV